MLVLRWWNFWVSLIKVSNMVSISMLSLLRWMSILNISIDSLLVYFSVIFYYLNSHATGWWLLFSLHTWLAMLDFSVSSYTIVFQCFFTLTFKGQLYSLPQLYCDGIHILLCMFKGVWFERNISEGLKSISISSWFCMNKRSSESFLMYGKYTITYFFFIVLNTSTLAFVIFCYTASVLCRILTSIFY